MDRAAFKLFATLEQDHWWFRGRRELYLPLLRQVLERDTPAAVPAAVPAATPGDSAEPGATRGARRILDVGCGVGGFLTPLAALGDVHGCELDEASVGFCRELGRTNTFVAASDRLPVPDASQDLVTLFDVLEHTPDDRAVLAEVRRVLRPGGHVVVSVPAYQFLFANNDRVAHHYRRYTRGGLLTRLSQAGLDVRKATYVNVILGAVIIPTVLLLKLKEQLFPVQQDATTNLSWRVPRPINALLARIFAGERHVLRHANAPLGHSLFAVARRPPA